MKQLLLLAFFLISLGVFRMLWPGGEDERDLKAATTDQPLANHEVRGLEVPVYREGTRQPIATLKIGRIHNIGRQVGPWRVRLLPEIVAQDVEIIAIENPVGEDLLHRVLEVAHRLQNSGAPLPINGLMKVTLSHAAMPGREWCADKLSIDSSGSWHFSGGVTLTDGIHTDHIRKVRISGEGWIDLIEGQPKHFFLIGAPWNTFFNQGITVTHK